MSPYGHYADAAYLCCFSTNRAFEQNIVCIAGHTDWLQTLTQNLEQFEGGRCHKLHSNCKIVFLDMSYVTVRYHEHAYW